LEVFVAFYAVCQILIISGSVGRSSRGIGDLDQSIADPWEVHGGIDAVVLSHCSKIPAQCRWQ